MEGVKEVVWDEEDEVCEEEKQEEETGSRDGWEVVKEEVWEEMFEGEGTRVVGDEGKVGGQETTGAVAEWEVGGEYGRVAGMDEIEPEDGEVKEVQGEKAVTDCNEVGGENRKLEAEKGDEVRLEERVIRGSEEGEEYVSGKVVGEGEIDECERKEEVSGEGEDAPKKNVKQMEHEGC